MGIWHADFPSLELNPEPSSFEVDPRWYDLFSQEDTCDRTVITGTTDVTSDIFLCMLFLCLYRCFIQLSRALSC